MSHPDGAEGLLAHFLRRCSKGEMSCIVSEGGVDFKLHAKLEVFKRPSAEPTAHTLVLLEEHLLYLCSVSG